MPTVPGNEPQQAESLEQGHETTALPLSGAPEEVYALLQEEPEERHVVEYREPLHLREQYQGLMGTIVEQPGEDTPRLALADWLDENAADGAEGDSDRARAELIRVQCALARLAEGTTQTEEAFELAHREHQLLTQYHEVWHAELPAIRNIRWHPFSRGFVSSASITMTQKKVGISDLQRMMSAAPIEHVHITVNRDERLGVLGKVPELQRLRGLSLSLWGTQPSRTALQKLIRHFPNLRSLSLVFNDMDDHGLRHAPAEQISDADIASFRPLTHLQSLELVQSPFTDEAWAAALRDDPSFLPELRSMFEMGELSEEVLTERQRK